MIYRSKCCEARPANNGHDLVWHAIDPSYRYSLETPHGICSDCSAPCEFDYYNDEQHYAKEKQARSATTKETNNELLT